MIYEKIVNPKTGRKVSIYNKLGQNILRKYLSFGGATKQVYQNDMPLGLSRFEIFFYRVIQQHHKQKNIN